MKQNYPIIIVLSLSLLIGILTLTHYGESWDDLSLQKYAGHSLTAYLTWPQQGVVQITEKDLGNYGPSYVMAIALGTRLLAAVSPLSPSDLRHLFYFITYLTGVWAFYALGLRWLTRNAALGATLLFMTQPILWGHAFMNPKDTPFLAFFLISIFLGFNMADSIQPFSFDSLTPSNKKTLALLTTLWLVSVFPLFIFTDAFHTIIMSLVQTAHAGGANIISLIASDIHAAKPEIYIEKYFVLFLRIRAIYFLLLTSVLIYVYRKNHPSSLSLFISIILPAILLGFTTSIRILGPFAGLIVVYYALRTKGRQSIPALVIYAVIAMITMYLTWPYLWADPIGHFWGSLKAMSAYPWEGQIFYNSVGYSSTTLPYSYLPVLFGIQLTEPVWVLSIAGLVLAAIGLRLDRVEKQMRTENQNLIEIAIFWFIIPVLGFIILHSALYDNFRQIFFVLPPVFWLAGKMFEKIKNAKWQIALVTLCLFPGVMGIIRLFPYEYIYYNSFVGGVDGAQGRFELDYWGTSFREAAEYVNRVAPGNSNIWIEGPAHLFALYARDDLKLYSSGEAERADHYNYVIATTRYNFDKTSYPNAKIIYRITRGNAVLSVIKQP